MLSAASLTGDPASAVTVGQPVVDSDTAMVAESRSLVQVNTGGVSLQQADESLPLRINGVRLLAGNRALIIGRFGGQLFRDVTNFTGRFSAPTGQPAVLRLELGPIHVERLGLLVDVGEIGMEVTTDATGGRALGNLLRDLRGSNVTGATLANMGSTLGLTPTQIQNINLQVRQIVRIALAQTLRSPPTDVDRPATSGDPGICPLVDLSFDPVQLDILGLNVNLDDGQDDPVTVELTAVEGPGNFLGNLLCAVVDGGGGIGTVGTSAGNSIVRPASGIFPPPTGGDGTSEGTNSLVPIRINRINVLEANRVRLAGTFAGQRFTATASLTGNFVEAQSGSADNELTLTVGELHLESRGLNVDMGEFHIRVAAEPGRGRLLGNLLARIAANPNVSDGANLITLQNTLNPVQADRLFLHIGRVIQGSLNNLFAEANITVSTPPDTNLPGICPVLNVTIEQFRRDIFAANVRVDARPLSDVDGVVDMAITAERGSGALGNLLCTVVTFLDDAGSGGVIG